jgi:hypothetical protein
MPSKASFQVVLQNLEQRNASKWLFFETISRPGSRFYCEMASSQ